MTQEEIDYAEQIVAELYAWMPFPCTAFYAKDMGGWLVVGTAFRQVAGFTDVIVYPPSIDINTTPVHDSSRQLRASHLQLIAQYTDPDQPLVYEELGAGALVSALENMALTEVTLAVRP